MATYASLQAIAQQAVGGNSHTDISFGDIVNEAGRFLCAMHEWTWLERPDTTLSLVADQAYVELPSDFDRLLAVHPASTSYFDLRLTDRDELNWTRGNELNYVQYVVGIEFPTQANTTSSPGNARLTLSPTPTAADTDAFRVSYRAKWTELSADASVPNVPNDMIPLLTELVRAFALSRFERGYAFNDAVNQLAVAPWVAALKAKYGQVQNSHGQLRGGVVPYPARPITTVDVTGTITV